MKRGVFSLLLIGLLAVVSTAALAHDQSIEWTFSSWDQQTADHQDAFPWKGLATLTVTNSSTQPWGDFHFGIGYGTGVIITATPAPTATRPSYSWVIGAGQTTLDYYFYSNPVLPGGTVSFTFYTDNTANQNAFFGLCGYPTPVPEPSSMLALSAGLMGLVGFVARKRR
ncbi:MAG: PEP-CTERM sorting domain-containing protein [Armatimonadetes bacterium]|nr:PEP-CTERM sorting domain-containing protein [Armatimonadota bacterium]